MTVASTTAGRPLMCLAALLAWMTTDLLSTVSPTVAVGDRRQSGG